MTLSDLIGLSAALLTTLLVTSVTVMRVQTDTLREQLSDLRSEVTMGIRPNQRPPSGPPRCRHTSPAVPVKVYDTLDGRPEIVRWLCPDCTEETHGPPPKGPGGSSYRFGGVTTAEAAVNIQRSLRNC